MSISAVNIASQMESSSYSRKILCSEVSAKLLLKQAPGIKLTKRGKTGSSKRKDEINAYWVGDTESQVAAVGANANKADLTDEKTC